MKKSLILGIGVIIGVLIAACVLVNIIDQRNCLCYAAAHSPSVTRPIDAQVLRAIEKDEVSDEIMEITTYTCKHGKHLLLQIWGTNGYTVRPFEEK